MKCETTGGAVPMRKAQTRSWTCLSERVMRSYCRRCSTHEGAINPQDQPSGGGIQSIRDALLGGKRTSQGAAQSHRAEKHQQVNRHRACPYPGGNSPLRSHVKLGENGQPACPCHKSHAQFPGLPIGRNCPLSRRPCPKAQRHVLRRIPMSPRLMPYRFSLR